MMNEEEFKISSVMCFCFLSSGVCVNANKTETFTRKNIASFLFKNVEMKIHDVIHLPICPLATRELCLAGDGGRF